MVINSQADLLRFTLAVLERLRIDYGVCGSTASGALGEPRMTLDLDIVVGLEESVTESLCAEIPEPEFYVSLPAATDAVRRRKQFHVIHPATGNKIDFIIAGRDEWSLSQLNRSRRVMFPATLKEKRALPKTSSAARRDTTAKAVLTSICGTAPESWPCNARRSSARTSIIGRITSRSWMCGKRSSGR